MSDAISYLNLLLLAAGFGFAAVIGMVSDRGFNESRAHMASLLSGQPGIVQSVALTVGLVLVSIFLMYLPFSRMFHAPAKYFFYHCVLWDEESLHRGSAMERDFAAYLGYRSSWSASHVRGTEKGGLQ